MWDLPGPGLEPVSPALAGGFSTTAPPGKPLKLVLTGPLWGDNFPNLEIRLMWPYFIKLNTPNVYCFLIVQFTIFSDYGIFFLLGKTLLRKWHLYLGFVWWLEICHAWKMIGNTGRRDNVINNTEEWKCISCFEKSEQSNVNRVQVYITPNIARGWDISGRNQKVVIKLYETLEVIIKSMNFNQHTMVSYQGLLSRGVMCPPWDHISVFMSVSEPALRNGWRDA